MNSWKNIIFMVILGVTGQEIEKAELIPESWAEFMILQPARELKTSDWLMNASGWIRICEITQKLSLVISSRDASLTRIVIGPSSIR